MYQETLYLYQDNTIAALLMEVKLNVKPLLKPCETIQSAANVV